MTRPCSVLLCAAALLLVPALVQGQPHPRKHNTKHTKTCGEGGEKDPSKPNWNPPKYVYLTCGAAKISSVEFASWGTPSGQCTGVTGTSSSFKKGSCNQKSTADKVKELCVGKLECRIPAGSEDDPINSGNGLFGDPCPGTPKRLAVVVSCAASTWGAPFLVLLCLATLFYLGAFHFDARISARLVVGLIVAEYRWGCRLQHQISRQIVAE